MFKVSRLFSFLFAAALPMYAFDPKDPADAKILKDAIDEAVDAAVEPLKTHNKTLLGELKKAKKGAEIDPAEFTALEAERDALALKVKDGEKALKTATTQAETAQAALDSEQGYNRGLLVDNGLMAALAEAGVKDPTFAKAAAALIKGSSKIEVVVDGAARTAKVGDKALGAFVKEWSQSDEGKTFVTAPGNGGGGAPGGAGGAAGGAPKAVTANLGGTPAERTAAIATQLATMNPTFAA